MKQREKFKKIVSEKKEVFAIKSDEGFPKAICLELSQVDIVNGYERDVIDTLRAFSDKNRYRAKNPHDLSKDKKFKHFFKIAKEAGCDKVKSLDVKSRNDKNRLFYFEKGSVCKILALCCDKSH